MAAATALFAPSPDEKEFGFVTVPVAASTKIFGGTMVALDASGNAVPASDTTGLVTLGKCVVYGGTVVDNSAGAAGALKVTVKLSLGRIAYLYNNDTGSPVVAADRYLNVNVLDDNTVAHTTSNSIVAGKFVGFDTDLSGAVVTTKCWIVFAN
jgi:hypothetical protein